MMCCRAAPTFSRLAHLIGAGFLACILGSVAMGQEPKWWTDQKKACGLDRPLSYNEWEARGRPCPATESQTRQNTGSTVDYDAQRRGEEQRRAEEERQRLAREAAEKKAAEEKQKQFEAERDTTYDSLKGSIGTRIHSNSGSTDDLTFKGSRIEIKTRQPAVVDRDFSGPNSAWKQLFCAASILGPAISKLNLRDEYSFSPDYQGFKDLALEATNALNGQTRGVPCRAAPGLPKFSSAYDSPGTQVEATERLITNVVKLADTLENAHRASSFAKNELSRATVPDTGTPLTDPMAEQRRLNAIRDAEKKRIWKAQQDFDNGQVAEKRAKEKLVKIQDDVKKALEDPESFGVVFASDAPAPAPTPAPATRTPPSRRHNP